MTTTDLVVARAQERRYCPPWSPEYKLRCVTGRPALVARLIEHLPTPLAAELADVLEATLQHRVQEELDKVHADINGVVGATLARMAAEADNKREELRRERFGIRSRLG